jgi:hypothetical protein
MATTLGYQDMLREIVAQDARKLDLVSDTRRMSASVVSNDNGNSLLLNVDRPTGEAVSFDMNEYARGQVSSDLGIPKRYFDRMLSTAPGLLAENVNHWLANEPERRLVRGFKGEDGGAGTGRAFVSDRFKRLDNIQVVRNVFPIFENIPGLQFQAAALTDTRFHLRAILPQLQAEIKVGDVVQAGIEIRNSEVGAGALVVQPFVWRLVCLNGMTVAEFGTRRNHIGKRIADEDVSFMSDEAIEADDHAFWLAVRDSAKSILTEVRFNEIAARLGEIVHGEKVVAPIAATEELQQRYSLTDSEREAILTNLVADGDMSQWGMLNAVTAAAKASESFDRQAEMEALGWEIAQLPTKQWASIAVAVAA